MKEVSRDTLLGIVFFGALAVLAYFTIVLTDFSFSEKPELRVRFVEAAGLKAGDPILVLGTRYGRVQKVGYDSQTTDTRRIVATLQLDRELKLKQGFKISIVESSFLGGRVVSINPGSPENPVIGEGTVLIGNVEQSPLAVLGEVVRENREDFNGIISGLKKIVDRTEKGEGTVGKLLKDDSLYNSFKETVDNAKTISENIKSGKGVLARLVNDEKLADSFSDTVNTLGDLSRDLRDGKGTLGKLFKEDTLYNNANEIIADIRAGKGTLGKLIYDTETADHVSKTAKNLDEITDGIAHGDGTLAKLLKDKTLYDNLAGASGDIKDLAADLNQGKGSLGKLMKDDTLYKDIQTTFKSINRSIEDGREAAPIGTLSALLFSSF